MAEKLKILVVDDEPSHRTMLRAVLTDEGYAVAEASDGTEAIQAVEKEAFDLILMDLRMTAMDGIEALTEIRKISPQVPVLIMTAYASVKTAVEALKAGAFDYLTKPLDIEELKILIDKALEQLPSPCGKPGSQGTIGGPFRFYADHRPERGDEGPFGDAGHGGADGRHGAPHGRERDG